MKWNYILEFYGTIGIPLLYLTILSMAASGGDLNAPVVFQLFGIACLFIGLIFWVISYFQLGTNFGVLPRKQKRVTAGLYSRYHHPMYIGITLTFFGLSLANQSIKGLLGVTILLIPVLYIRAKYEEKRLHD